MEFRVLGPLEVRDGDRSVPLAGAKQRALLALLLVHANHVLSRDRLIDELWGDQPPDTAVQSLQVYVSRLRKLLPTDTLLTRPPGYLLELEPGELDLDSFERLLAEGREALARGDPARASRVLHDALALWRGPALAEFAFEPFAQAEIGRLEDLRLAAVEERIEADLALDRHADLIGELEALIAENPYRERLRGQLMRALYRSGRQAEALDAYRDARSALVDQLGIEPSAELQQLEKAILTQDTDLDSRFVAERPRGTVTFLFSDVEGSTRLLKQLRDNYGSVLGEHQRLLREAFVAHGGEEVDTQGDAFFYVFSRARDAAAAAVDGQRALASHTWPEGAEFRVRIGMHTGEPVLSAEGYHGMGVHRAARIMAAGHGGQVLASQATASLLVDDELDGVTLRDLGEHGLKDMDRPERIYQLEIDDLPSTFPPLRTDAESRLVQDAALAAPSPLLDEAPPLPGPLVPEPSFPFVGRESERAALASLLERAESGEGGLVLLSGESGAGKTRLVRELARDAAAAGVLVCYGASDAAVTVPYQPLREWLDFLLEVCDPATLADCVGDGGEMVGRIAPAFATLAGRAPPPPGADPTIDRYLLQSAVADFVRRLSRLRPLLLVIEDIHWSDGETLLLLARLARMVPESRMLVVATLRQPGAEIERELADTLADLSRLEGVTRLALGNLTAEDVGAFVRDSTDAEASLELVAAIRELSDGTPLLLCELWRELVSSGAVEISNAQVSLARPVAELRGSQRIGELVEQRLSRLSPETCAMVELAAVTGPRFELRLLAEAARLGRDDLVASVEEAVAIGMLEELPEPDPACRFTHELVRRAIYDRIRRVRRPELHLRVAEALERTHAVDSTDVVPELAYHFTLAAPLAGVERGVEYNLRAAAAATATLAYDEAAARLSSALELGIADPLDHARVQVELGLLLYQTGRVAESEAMLTASLTTATSLEERGLAARALVHLSAERLSSDPGVGSAEIVPIAEEAIRTFEQLREPLGLAAAENLLGHALGREGRTEESFAALNRALAHAETAGDQVMRRDVIGFIAMRLCEGSTPAGEAIDRFEEFRSSSRNDPVLDTWLRRCFALVLAMAGRFDEARMHILATSVLETADQTILSLSSRWLVANAKELAGDPAGAKQELVAAFRNMRDARGDGSEARALRAAAELALLCCDQGDWDEAAEYLSYGRHVDELEPVGGKMYFPLRLAARGRVAAQRGELAEAVELAERAVEVAERSDWLNIRARTWLALAEGRQANGQPVEAEAAVATALRLYEAKGNVAAAARLQVAAS